MNQLKLTLSCIKLQVQSKLSDSRSDDRFTTNHFILKPVFQLEIFYFGYLILKSLHKKRQSDHAIRTDEFEGGFSMTKMLRALGTLLVIFSLMGCGMNKTEEVKDNAAGTETETETDVNDTTANDSTTDANVNNESDENDGNPEVADDVADKIVEMEEVESANVIVTDTNAYVAVVLKEGAEGSEMTENKIADEVRSADATFKNVYVSMNPDFVKQMNEYGTKIREGKPVEGFFEEFTDSMKRVFPDAE